MSTKNLAKTVIEGGRYAGNKWDRRHSSAEERVHARAYCKRVAHDPELADEEEIEPRQPVYKGFTDKLAPMYRWLDAQVGRPWSEVRSEVFQKFDTRTTAGRHITFDHLLREVVDTESGFNHWGHIVDPDIPKEDISGKPSYFYRYNDYYVDQGGFLRKTYEHGRRRRRISWAPIAKEEEYVMASKWLAGRMIKADQGKFHWITANEGIWLASWIDPNGFFQTYPTPQLTYYLLDNGHHEERHTSPLIGTNSFYTFTTQVHSDFWNKVEHPFSFRERGELTQEERSIFKELPRRIRDDILSFTKGR